MPLIHRYFFFWEVYSIWRAVHDVYHDEMSYRCNAGEWMAEQANGYNIPCISYTACTLQRGGGAQTAVPAGKPLGPGGGGGDSLTSDLVCVATLRRSLWTRSLRA